MTRGEERGRGLYLATPHHMTNGGVPKRQVASAGSRVMNDCSEMRTQKGVKTPMRKWHTAQPERSNGVNPPAAGGAG